MLYTRASQECALNPRHKLQRLTLTNVLDFKYNPKASILSMRWFVVTHFLLFSSLSSHTHYRIIEFFLKLHSWLSKVSISYHRCCRTRTWTRTPFYHYFVGCILEPNYKLIMFETYPRRLGVKAEFRAIINHTRALIRTNKSFIFLVFLLKYFLVKLYLAKPGRERGRAGRSHTLTFNIGFVRLLMSLCVIVYYIAFQLNFTKLGPWHLRLIHFSRFKNWRATRYVSYLDFISIKKIFCEGPKFYFRPRPSYLMDRPCIYL